jgi:ASTRA-associated protein 1
MEQGPPVPTYILRGHDAPVHALNFYDGNSFLASGDSDGWLVIWSLSSRRPLAVWKAHDGGVLQIRYWARRGLVR